MILHEENIGGILSYYTKAEIKRIKKQWKASDLESHIKKALGQTLEAYLRKEYALVIPFLATVWEVLSNPRSKQIRSNPKRILRSWLARIATTKYSAISITNMIIGTCYSIEDVVEGVPNRHGVAHSWYIKYPTQKQLLMRYYSPISSLT